MRSGLLLVLAAAAASAQTFTAGPQVLTYLSDVDDTDQPYGIYIPAGFDAQKKYPLLIGLHSEGTNHRLELRRIFGRSNRPGETDAEATRHFPPFADVDMFIATPLARGSMGYEGVAERDVYDVLADVKRRFPIDESRVYLAGSSVGGGGALRLALTRPDVWAAVAALCPVVPTDLAERFGNALHVPVKIFQGEIDPLVKAQDTRALADRLRAAGVKVEYVELRGVRHNVWDFAYRDGSLLAWLRQHRRPAFPEQVRYRSNSYSYAVAYWLRLDRLTPGEYASVTAAFASPNRLKIETAESQAFSLDLSGHALVNPKQPLSVNVDGTELRFKTGSAPAFARSGSKWTIARAAPVERVKRAGAEGPISDAIGSRHIYVYGTLGSPTPEELARRKGAADRAANWSTGRSPLLLTFLAMADDQIQEVDAARANLVLFGTRETNSVIARLAGHLPLELNAGAADYGLVYIWPVNGRYVVVNSGLPWWTRADQAGRRGYSSPYRLLETFQDFVLFKGGLDRVVAEGRFDAAWTLPKEAAGAMRRTGAVTVR